jgi:hypothetical protein
LGARAVAKEIPEEFTVRQDGSILQSVNLENQLKPENAGLF